MAPEEGTRSLHTQSNRPGTGDRGEAEVSRVLRPIGKLDVLVERAGPQVEHTAQLGVRIEVGVETRPPGSLEQATGRSLPVVDTAHEHARVRR